MFLVCRERSETVAKAKYKKWITEEGLSQLSVWAKDGLTDEEIAEKIGINPKTLYDWYKKYSNIRNTIELARNPESQEGNMSEADILRYYGINEKQHRFADEWIKTGVAYSSALKAGYSESYANTFSHKLLGNTRIQRYIQDRMQILRSNTIAEQEEVLEHFTKIMRREEYEHSVVTVKRKEEKWVPVIADGREQLKKQTVEIEEPKVVPFPTRVSDANKAAEMLGKRYAMWTDKQELTATVEVNKLDSIIEQLSDDDD